MDQSIILLLIGLMTLLLIVTVMVLIIYSGLLSDVTVGVGPPPISDAVIYYKFGKGSYKDITGSAYIFTEVTSIAPKYKCFGVYYDNPDKVPSEKLRWAVGVIMRDNQTNEMDPVIVDKLRKEGYKEFHFPHVENVVKANFPCRTQISVLLGMYKVYPKLAHYVKEKKLCAHPWLEIYDGETVHFMAPLSKQEGFYVPETTSKSTTQSSDQIKEKKGKQILAKGKNMLNYNDEDQNIPKTSDKDTADKEMIGSKQDGPNNTVNINSGVDPEPRSKSVGILSVCKSDVSLDTTRSHSVSSIEKNVIFEHLKDENPLNKQNKSADYDIKIVTNSNTSTPVGNDSVLELKNPNSTLNSSASSIESTADTTASSYYSSEISYNSETSQNTANFNEISSDSDCTDDNSTAITLKLNGRNKTPEK